MDVVDEWVRQVIGCPMCEEERALEESSVVGRHERRGKHEAGVRMLPLLREYRQRAEDFAAAYPVTLEEAVRVVRDSVDSALGIKP